MKGKRFALNAYIALLYMNPIKVCICFILCVFLREIHLSLSQTYTHTITDICPPADTLLLIIAPSDHRRRIPQSKTLYN